MSNKKLWRFALVCLTVLMIPAIVAVAEHPKEHPSSKKHSKVTKENMAEAIEAYVKTESDLKGGYFLVYDKKAGQALVLTLKLVHKERFSKIGKNTYFACADFETPEGKVYDLDIFMQGPNKDELVVTQITVHKEAGVARYTWHKVGGVWKMKPVPGMEGAEEEPEGFGTKSDHHKEHPTKEHPKKEHPIE